ncbi:MAG: type II secretion system protein E, partial [Rhizobiaceae bacterium]|nr:type II secretion system protein E [Rhizobiaceae bacterium]
DKTMHDFPSGDGQVERSARLGDLLVTWQAIDDAQLHEALAKQRHQRRPLGRILIDEGWLQEEVIAEAVAFQAGYEMRVISEDDVLTARGRLSTDLCLRLRILPVQGADDGHMMLATAVPLDPQALAEIVAACGVTPKVCIVRDSQITAGLDLLCERDAADGRRVSRLLNDALPRLGDILVERGDISPEALRLALADYSPQRDGLIGAYLAARDVVFNQAIEDALAEQRRRIERLRENQKISPLQPVAGKAI